MREVLPYRPDLELPRMVWLYEEGDWQQTIDPIRQRQDGDVLQEYTDAGYRDPGRFSYPALEVRYPVTPGQEADGLKLWVREEHPQCLIEIEWLGPLRTERQAKEKLAEFLNRIGQGVNVDDGRMLFGNYLDPRLRWWESEHGRLPSGE